MTVSRSTLKTLAAVVWIVGGVVLLVKGFELLYAATEVRSGIWRPVAAGVFGLAIGIAKGWYLFRPRYRANMVRIRDLKQPRLWQFYTPGFFVALAVMVTAGAFLSRAAAGHYGLLLAVGALDLGIATALLGSSLESRFG